MCAGGAPVMCAGGAPVMCAGGAQVMRAGGAPVMVAPVPRRDFARPGAPRIRRRSRIVAGFAVGMRASAERG
jgi:hypothetical protein